MVKAGRLTRRSNGDLLSLLWLLQGRGIRLNCIWMICSGWLLARRWLCGLDGLCGVFVVKRAMEKQQILLGWDAGKIYIGFRRCSHVVATHRQSVGTQRHK